jgi:hypothetical protein
MGMGKSLTTLVLIGKTMPDAHQWVQHQNHLQGVTLAEKPCRATLVVVPSRGKRNTSKYRVRANLVVLINTWIKEIDGQV